MNPKNLRIVVAMLAATAGLGGTAIAGSDKYQVSGGQVVVVCPLTVGGGFEAKTEAITGSVSVGSDQPRAVGGALAVDLRTLKTGIGMRDRHMKDNYLEVEKGPAFGTATIEDITIDKLDGKTSFNATLVLHGERRSITGSATLERRDGGYRVQAEFPVNVSHYHITKPTYLGVGVQDEIRIKIALTAVPLNTVAAK
jgi:polyisoprenoid-binding protein YceI